MAILTTNTCFDFSQIDEIDIFSTTFIFRILIQSYLGKNMYNNILIQIFWLANSHISIEPQFIIIITVYIIINKRKCLAFHILSLNYCHLPVFFFCLRKKLITSSIFIVSENLFWFWLHPHLSSTILSVPLSWKTEWTHCEPVNSDRRWGIG